MGLGHMGGRIRRAEGQRKLRSGLHGRGFGSKHPTRNSKSHMEC